MLSTDVVYNGWDDVNYTPISTQKEDYLGAFARAMEIAKSVPTAIASLPDNLPPCFLYSSSRYVQSNTLRLRIDLFWDLGMLHELIDGLTPNWRPIVDGCWGENENSGTGDYYLKFGFHDTNILLTVCLSEDNYLYSHNKRKDVRLVDGFEVQLRLDKTDVLVVQLIAELATVCADQEWWRSDFALPEDFE